MSARRIVWAPTLRRLCLARDFMHAHYGDAIDLKAVADAAGLSPFHFQRSFVGVFGNARGRARGAATVAHPALLRIVLDARRLSKIREVTGRGAC